MHLFNYILASLLALTFGLAAAAPAPAPGAMAEAYEPAQQGLGFHCITDIT